MLTANSWADALHAATTPTDKARILLTRAQQRSSKRLAADDIAVALIHLNRSYENAIDLLRDYDLPWSQSGLHKAAERLLQTIE